MSRQQARHVAGATPAKLALIGILTLVLFGVVASNWPISAATDEAEAAETGATGASPVAVAAAPTAVAASAAGAPAEQAGTPASPFGEFATDDNWPETPLSEVTKFDPLAVSEWALPPEAQQKAEKYDAVQIKELLKAENAIIFMAGDTRVARIGTREFRVGDVIGGFKISDISSRGVVLSEVE
jgi:hypothetical protein